VPKSSASSPSPWLIHFFQRHPADDPDRSIPAREFLDSVSDAVAAEIVAVLAAVAEAPPPAFSGGGKWEAMKAEMSGFYEVRVTDNDAAGRKMNHRLFCKLVRDAADLGGSSIVCVGGLSKPQRSAARPGDYRTVKRLGVEFERRRTVVE
jgi:hypothetical protein